MPEKRRKLGGILLTAAVPVLAFAGTWAFLGLFHSPYADWLSVETPRFAVAGQPFDLRISVKKASQPSVLAVSVYVLGWNFKPVGRLPGLRPPVPVRAGERRDFRVDVRPMEKMAYLQFVLWLSPAGDWNTRTAGANTESIRVRRAGTRQGSDRFRQLRTFVNDKAPNPDAAFVPGGRPAEPEVYPASSAPFRMALAALLAGGGLAVLFGPARRGPDQEPGARAGQARLLWTASSILLFLLALSEVFLVEGRLADWGRRLILRLDIYNFRQVFQKGGLALIAAAVAALLLLDVRVLRSRRDTARLALAATALAGCAGLSLAGALSFHYVDVLRGISFAGISLVDAFKACFAAALILFVLWGPRPGTARERKKRTAAQSNFNGERCP